MNEPKLSIEMAIFLLLPALFFAFMLLLAHIILLLNWIGIKQNEKLLATVAMWCLPTLLLYCGISILFGKWNNPFKEDDKISNIIKK